MARTGRPEKYPYDRLFDGRPHVLLESDAILVRTLRYAARRRGLRLEQQKLRDGRYVVTVHAGNGTRAPDRPARPVRLP